MTKSYMRYWGKAKPADGEATPYHLLAYHSLDVAAVAQCWLQANPMFLANVADTLQLNEEDFISQFVFFAAIHDLGKFSSSFQGMVQGVSPQLVSTEAKYTNNVRHDQLGYVLWIRKIAPLLIKTGFADITEGNVPQYRHALSQWVSIVTGHHGIPPTLAQSGHASPVLPQRHFSSDDMEAAQLFCADAEKLLRPKGFNATVVDQAWQETFKQLSWQLAGVMVLADWLGSDQSIFEYCSDNTLTLDDYWKNYALPRATLALEKSNQSANKGDLSILPYQGLKHLFPFIDTATPLQNHADQCQIGKQPQLFIIEDVTGAGKTEAALALTHRLLANQQADGLYIGLPTMATANGMYARLTEVYQKFYPAEAVPSLVLAHGSRHLHQGFSDSVGVAEQEFDKQYAGELSASANCNAWIADSAKKALLAEVGVGTLDQVLLSVLPARFQSLRLLGTSRKVLIFDEIHALDSYMSELLATVLTQHARSGGHAILLSATLPFGFRRKLMNAWQKGAGILETPVLNHQAPYPLISQLGGAQLETPLDTRKEVKRFVAVEFAHNAESVTQQIVELAMQGHAVCWIRNTVDDALTAYNAVQSKLQPALECGKANLQLFHSRFARVDRARIEDDVLNTFGKHSTAKQRAGQVLVATQVVEQSLDLDFDYLFSDLAPVDLLIQRAGRLQRHQRDSDGNRSEASEQRPAPVFTVFAPEWTDDPSASWLKPDWSGTGAVYKHHGQLWLSQQILRQQGGIRMPEDARLLIESVYDLETAEIPPGLESASYEHEGAQDAARSMGAFNVLNMDSGYNAVSGGTHWDSDVRVPTRLSEQESTDVVLCHVENGQLKPYANVDKYAWEFSILSVPDRLVGKLPDLGIHKALVEEFQQRHKRYQYCRFWILESGGKVQYKPETGLCSTA